jgi:hypothetical protein
MNLIRLLLQDHEMFHSEFQIHNFIVCRTGGTIYGAYKQAIRELWHRLFAIVVEFNKLPAISSSDPRHVVEDCAEVSASILRWSESAPAIRDTLRESVILYFLAKSLRQKLGELDCELKQKYEEELWVHRVRCAIAVEFLSIGHISGSTVEMIHALPIVLRKPIVEVLLNPTAHESLINWYLSYSLELPTLSVPSRNEVTNELLKYLGETMVWLKLQVTNISPKSVSTSCSGVEIPIPHTGI